MVAKAKPYVSEFFSLNMDAASRLQHMKPNFGYNGYGEFVFFRTYSRIKNEAGDQENWADVVTRVINGTFSIRKDWYLKNFIHWNEDYWQAYAARMAVSLFNMYWFPGGRGLWAMGTPFVYERGSMALNNCGFTVLGGNETLANDFHWMMDALMLGVGVGFEAERTGLKRFKPIGTYIYEIPDTREGWADSIKLLVEAYTLPNRRKPIFKYDKLRPKGAPIKGFGGKASGPEPLIYLHKQIETIFEAEGVDEVRLKADIGNMIGVCVVAGNVRRSAELLKGSVHDGVFMSLKDYEAHPDRQEWGWMSNNSAALEYPDDFEQMGEVAKRVITRGEPGIMNLRNFPFGRIGKPIPVRRDKARGLNPCGEIPLEDKELCNVAETCPTQCQSTASWYEACEFATMYCSSVSLLPTHREETNKIVARNRRIGVGIIDWTGWVYEHGLNKVTSYMRKGYDKVTIVNQEANAEAGVPEAIRKTTIKPGGTTTKLVGKTPGIGYPTFDYTNRRTTVDAGHPITKVLDRAGIPSQPANYDPTGTLLYEYPILQGPVPPAFEISLWEQAVNLATVQREWADNSVSNTLYFKPKWVLIAHVKDETKFTETLKKLTNGAWAPDIDWESIGNSRTNTETGSVKVVFKENYWTKKLEMQVYSFDPNHEEDVIEKVLSAFAPLIKACSLLPHTPNGVYEQMPEEGISKDEYEARLAAIKPIDWSDFRGSDGQDEKFCSGPTCEIPK